MAITTSPCRLGGNAPLELKVRSACCSCRESEKYNSKAVERTCSYDCLKHFLGSQGSRCASCALEDLRLRRLVLFGIVSRVLL